KYYQESPEVDPQGPPIADRVYRESTKQWHTDVRVLRGGSWHDAPMRSAGRSGWMQFVRNLNFGFRIICQIDKLPQPDRPVQRRQPALRQNQPPTPVPPSGKLN